MKKFGKFTHTISSFFDRIAGIAVVLMMLVVVYNVIVRIINGALPQGSSLPSIIGEQDFVGVLMTLAVSFALAACALKGSHIAVSILYDKMKPRTRFILDLIVGSVSIIFFSIFTYRIFADAAVKQAAGEVTLTAALPTFPFIIATGIGLIVLCLAIFYNHTKSAKDGIDS